MQDNKMYGKLDKRLEQLGPQVDNDPEIQALLAAVELNPGMVDDIDSILCGMIYKQGGDPTRAGEFPIVTSLPPGTVALGPVDNGRRNGPTFYFPEPDPSNLRHIAVVGETRFGKTTILRHICLERMLSGQLVWMFDLEDEFARLIPALPESQKPVALTPDHLMINFFQPPGEWIEPRQWLGVIGLLLRGQTYLRDGSENLFIDNVLELFIIKGVLAGGNEYPSLAETLGYFQILKLSGSSKRGKEWLESLTNRLTMLVHAFNATSRVTNSNMLQRLAQQSVIFRLRRYTGVPLRFLVNFLLIWLSCYKEGVQE